MKMARNKARKYRNGEQEGEWTYYNKMEELKK
jgi:hypothetical protein